MFRACTQRRSQHGCIVPDVKQALRWLDCVPGISAAHRQQRLCFRLSVTVGSLKLVSGSRGPGVPGQAPSDPCTFVGAPPVDFVCSGDDDDDDAGGWWWHTLSDSSA